jgi:hypothetical protein
MSKRPIRIANFSGALGDWFQALAAAVRGEPVDAVIGDYLAEVTMAMVAAGFCARPEPTGLAGYYCDVFLQQLLPELEVIAERRIKVIVNAGAFNPAGLADAIRAVAAGRGLKLSIAYTRGDDLLPQLPALVAAGQVSNLDTGLPIGTRAERVVAANAYMGGWGIAEALAQGADIVICGRVSDASLVVGPAAWWHGWRRDDWNRLAGAAIAGHVIECGPQATGGQFSGFLDVGTPIRIGHPIAEIAEDGSSVITKRVADDGAVTIDTVTAQLVYEIQGPDYLNPDVVLHVDSVKLSQEAPNRVLLSGVTGGPPPQTTKLGCLYPNGWRMSFWIYATAPDVDAKIDWFRRQMASVADTLKLDEYHFDALGRAAENASTKAEATVAIRVAASSQQKTELQRLRGALGGFGMGGIPGFFGDAGSDPGVRVDFWPGLVRQDVIRQQVVMDDGRTIDIPIVPSAPYSPRRVSSAPPRSLPVLSGKTRRVALGDLVHARSGDKGANASLGVWARQPKAWAFVRAELTAAKLMRLIDLAQDVRVERFELDNINGLLFTLHGYFGVSGSGCVALDNLGKALGEFLRARVVDVPVELLDGDKTGGATAREGALA